MSNYKKDKSYIKQRLEYVSPVDYISELEGKIEYLEYLKNENERLNNIIDEFENWLKTIPNYFMDTRSLNSGIEKQNGMKYIIDLSLEKLKELKGSDE